MRGRPNRAPRWSRGIGCLAPAACVVLVLLTASSRAAAFCGFFVSGADAKLSNDASMVVLMREGTRTVLSMRNDYAGPPEDFALVIPVPVVLQQENVRTLEAGIFDRIDALGAPRLVEYWEQDPCAGADESKEGGTGTRARGEEGSMGSANKRYGTSVTIEARFAVGEYQILILSAKDSAGLDGWLREEHYKIPAGAEAALRPYVAAGSKFFVAKVDTKKVRFENGRARLSPLRFHYDSEAFSLPVRLGLLNSPGTQDIIVNVIARHRYDVANYPNVLIPTNLDVDDAVATFFPKFYAALFDRTVERNPRAVVTEYAWSSGSCDPCPTSPLSDSEASVLGGDVIPGFSPHDLTLTRLHARYTKDALGEDLVFRAAPAIEGGREGFRPGKPHDDQNTFQARYAIRHRWRGPIECASPDRDNWGGPPGGEANPPTPAKDLALVPRGPVPLGALVRSDVPALGLSAERTNELPTRLRMLFLLAGGTALGAALLGLLLVLRRRGVV